jgi:hypothetical protein
MSGHEYEPTWSEGPHIRRRAEALIAHPPKGSNDSAAILLEALGIQYKTRIFPQIDETMIIMGNYCFTGAGGAFALSLALNEMCQLPSVN